MSAPALRPVARMRPVLLERVERQRAAHCLAALFLVIWIVYDRLDSGQASFQTAIVCALVGSTLLPVAQGVAPGHQPVWDTALPADLPGYARVRLLCGVAGAALLLAVGISVYAVLFGIAGTPSPGGAPEYPGWFPLVVFAGAITCYLFASAVFLRTPDPFVGLLCLAALFVLYVASVRGPVLLLDPAEIERVGAPRVLAWTACLLGLAALAAYAAALAPQRFTEPAARAARHKSAYGLPLAPSPLPVLEKPRQNRPLTPPRPHAPALLAPHAPRPVWRSGPHPTPATLAVFRHHFALMCRFAIVPALTLFVWLVLLIGVALGEAREDRTVRHLTEAMGLSGVCAWMALSWAVLVWTAEHGARRKWNDALPVGTTKRRMLHSTAGAAWLLLFLPVMVAGPLGAAAAAGMLNSSSDLPTWLWLGLPMWTLTLYLAATFVLFAVRMAWDVFSLLALFLVSPGMGLMERLVRAGAENVDPPGWNYAAAVLWLVLYAAAAAGAIALSDWVRRLDRLPTLREMRGLLHEWAGTRPGSPLRGHAGR